MKRAFFSLLAALALASGALAQDDGNSCPADAKPVDLQDSLDRIREEVLKHADTYNTPTPGKDEADGDQGEGTEEGTYSCPRPPDDGTVTVRVETQDGKTTPDGQKTNGQDGKTTPDGQTTNGQDGKTTPDGQTTNGQNGQQGTQGEEDKRSPEQRFEDEHPFWAAFFDMLPDLIDIIIDNWPGPGPDWPETEYDEDDEHRGSTWPDNQDGPPIVNQDGPPIINQDGPPIVIDDDSTTSDPIEQAVAWLIDAGLVDGESVADVEEALEDVAKGKYDEEGEATVEDILRAALDGGLFGGGDGGNDDGGCFGGGGEAEDGGCFGGGGGGQNPDVWGGILDKVKTTTLEKLESWTTKQLDSWINKHPTLQKWLQALGIDGKYIVNGVKNIWGILTENGSLSDKVAALAALAQNTLCDMAANVLKYGLDKLGQWLGGVAQKWIGKLTGWIKQLLGGHGIKIPETLLNKFQAALNKLVGRGIGRVVDIGKGYVEKIVDGLRPEGESGGGGGGETVAEYETGG